MPNLLSIKAARVSSLAYVGIEAADPAKWASFAAEILGAQVVAAGSDGTYLARFDDHAQRVSIQPGSDGKLGYVGWDARDPQNLAALISQLEVRGVKCERGTEEECRLRHIRHFVWFLDPAGNRAELCYGSDVGSQPFRPSRDDISGFVAVGHVVIGVPNPQAVEQFYVDNLGFKVTDYMDLNFSGRNLSLSFLRCADGRNHSVALMNGDGLDHIMVEVNGIDDVGRTLTLCRKRDIPVRGQLGRHNNDLMISFYMTSPSGLKIEYGCGGNYIDDETWKVRYFTSASLWGHSLG